eukprot:588655-Amphidinium_carterae.1
MVVMSRGETVDLPDRENKSRIESPFAVCQGPQTHSKRLQKQQCYINHKDINLETEDLPPPLPKPK